jgi:nitrogen fixation protein
VLQDRLVKEMRLRGIKDLGSANELLRDEFLAAINGKFCEEAASAVDYHRRLPKGLRLEDVFVFEQQRSVQNDRTICWEGRWYQLSGPTRDLPRPKERVLARRRLDGSREVLRNGKRLEFHELPGRPRKPAPIPVAAKPAPTRRWSPPDQHAWRKPFTHAGAAQNQQRMARLRIQSATP